MKSEENVTKVKKYVKVPKRTFTLQAIFIVFVCVVAISDIPVMVFGLPLQSFIATWGSFAVLGISSIVWLNAELKKEE